jgi:hypothetical protein
MEHGGVFREILVTIKELFLGLELIVTVPRETCQAELKIISTLPHCMMVMDYQSDGTFDINVSC